MQHANMVYNISPGHL